MLWLVIQGMQQENLVSITGELKSYLLFCFLLIAWKMAPVWVHQWIPRQLFLSAFLLSNCSLYLLKSYYTEKIFQALLRWYWMRGKQRCWYRNEHNIFQKMHKTLWRLLSMNMNAILHGKMPSNVDKIQCHISEWCLVSLGVWLWTVKRIINPSIEQMNHLCPSEVFPCCVMVGAYQSV